MYREGRVGREKGGVALVATMADAAADITI